MARKQGKAARPKQGFIADMEPPSIKEIDAAAEKYVEARDARMAMLRQEMEDQEQLMGLMKKHGLRTYEYEGKEVIVAAQEKVKVKRKAEEKADLD